MPTRHNVRSGRSRLRRLRSRPSTFAPRRGDWRVTDASCAAACVLDWAQIQLVQRGAPDRAEHTWYLAAAAPARARQGYYGGT